MNLGKYSSYWARLRGDRPAVVFRGETLSWAELDRRADGVAARLQSLGVRRGDRVGVMLPNRLEWPIAYAAIHKTGAVLVPLNPRFGDDEIREIQALVDCRLVVSLPELAGKVDPACALPLADAPGDVGLYPLGARTDPISFAEAERSGETPEPVDLSPDDPAFLCLTSGSTGFPKGVVLTHGGVIANLHAQAALFELTSEERILLIAPFAFTGGVISSYSPGYLLGACVYVEEAMDPERALRLLVEEGITSLTAVPILFDRIAAAPGFESADLSRFRIAITGGAPVPETLLRRYLAKGTSIRQTYGCTEGAGMIAAPSAEVAAAKPVVCGWPLPSVELRLVDDAGEKPAPGEPGEILIRGPQVTTGYWNARERSAEHWLGDWFRTGDLGVIDDDGHLRIVDRKKNMIISGGANVYAAEVERGLAALPGVAEVLVFGRPDPEWGERVVAVVHGTDLDPRALLENARERLGAYKAPKEIVVSAAPLPKTTTGKVSRADVDRFYATLRDLPRATAAPKRRARAEG